MAPTPALTNTLYCDYTGAMGARSFQVRFLAPVTSDTAYEAVQGLFMPAVVPLWHTSVETVGFRWRAKGATFSLPIAGVSTFTGTNNGAFSPVNYPRFLSLSGRGFSSGAEVRLYLYGCVFSMPEDYRLSPSDSAQLTALHDAWGDLTGTADACTEQEDIFAVRNFINAGFNSYYERKARTA